MTSRLSRLYAIIDPDACDEPLRLAQRALASGCPVLQLRAKRLDDRSFLDLGLRLRTMCTKAGAAFIINDRADIARLTRADGLHLGQDDLAIRDARRVIGAAQIGISTHDPDQAARAEHEGADLIAFGPIFETRTKVDPDPVVGLGALSEVCRSVGRPVVAIGGITPDNAADALRAGARYIAVISALPSFLGEA